MSIEKIAFHQVFARYLETELSDWFCGDGSVDHITHIEPMFPSVYIQRPQDSKKCIVKVCWQAMNINQEFQQLK